MPNKERLVSAYMLTNPSTVTAEATFEEAAKTMIKNKTNGLVVVDKDNKVVGILSSWDLIEYVVPDYLEIDRHLAEFEAWDQFGSRILKLKNDPVSAFMTKEVHTAKPTMNLIAAATMLSEFRIRQLPVVDDDGILVGYVNRTTIKLAIGEVLGISE